MSFVTECKNAFRQFMSFNCPSSQSAIITIRFFVMDATSITVNNDIDNG